MNNTDGCGINAISGQITKSHVYAILGTMTAYMPFASQYYNQAFYGEVGFNRAQNASRYLARWCHGAHVRMYNYHSLTNQLIEQLCRNGRNIFEVMRPLLPP